MNTASPLVAAQRETVHVSLLADYVRLIKPRIAVLVLVCVAVSCLVACGGQLQPWIAMHAILGTGLVAASAAAWNQIWERQADAKMHRTASRPLPAGRLTLTEASLFASLLLVMGIVVLVRGTTIWATGLALLTWVLYVLVYTPLKQRSTWNTCVGAISGALPVCIGWAATGTPWDLRAVGLFGILFLWQFPHFMAIAWRFRKDYRTARMKMLTVVDPTGRRAGMQAFLGAVALIPTTMLLFPLSPQVQFLPWVAVGLNVWYAQQAWRFWQRRDDLTAGRLLLGSLIHLPALLLVCAVQSWIF